MDIQDFEVSFENPLLYAAGVSALSLLVNVYFCCRRCRGSGRQGRAGIEESVELTRFDSRPVVPESDADAVVDADLDLEVGLDAEVDAELDAKVDAEVDAELDAKVDAEVGQQKNRKLTFTPATSEDSTQTEDCAFYEMMGARFSDELDYYQRMNMGKRDTTRVGVGRGVGSGVRGLR